MARKKKEKVNKILEAKKYYLYFMMYAVFGWLYEVFLEVFIYKWGYSDRGVLTGPYCPVYGVGALLFIFLVRPLIKKKPLKKTNTYDTCSILTMWFSSNWCRTYCIIPL